MPELVATRIRSAQTSRRIGAWLADRGNADLVSDRLVVLLSFLFSSLNDRKLRRLLLVMLRRQARELDLVPLLASLLAALRERGKHQELFDLLLESMHRYIAERQDQIAEIVEDRSDWWVPRQVDHRVAHAITQGVVDYLGDLRRRDHEARESLDEEVDRIIVSLRQSPAYRAKVAELRNQILNTPQAQAYFDTLWQVLKLSLEQELSKPSSRLRQALSGLLSSLGATVAGDNSVQARMDCRIEQVVLALIEPWRKDSVISLPTWCAVGRLTPSSSGSSSRSARTCGISG